MNNITRDLVPFALICTVQYDHVQLWIVEVSMIDFSSQK